MEDRKRCTKCLTERFISEFPVYNREKGWRRGECRFCYRARMNAHYIGNRDHILARARANYNANPSAKWTAERRASANARSKSVTASMRSVVFDYYGWQCECCGESEPKFLTIDHVRNDGAKMRKLHGVGSRLYRWLIKHNFPEGFRTLCCNCNFGRARNGGVCPHELKEGSTTIAQASTRQAIGRGSARPL